MAKKEDTGLILWFEGIMPVYLHGHYPLEPGGPSGPRVEGTGAPVVTAMVYRAALDRRGAGARGELPELEVRRRAEILKQVAGGFARR